MNAKYFILSLATLLSVQANALVTKVYRYKTDKATVQRTAQDFQLNEQETHRFNRVLSVTKYTDIYEERLEYQDYSYYDFECSDISSNGSAGDWKGYFSASTKQQPIVLAKAIKGLGKATAPALVRQLKKNNNRKPRSWSAFKRLVKRANQNAKGMYSRVIIEHGDFNRQSLGYETADCRSVLKVESYAYTVERLVESINSGKKDYNINLNVSNSPLLKGENETYKLELKVKANVFGDITVKPVVKSLRAHNRYSSTYSNLGSGEFTVNLQGNGRILKKVNKDDVVISLKKQGKELFLDATNNLTEVLSRTGGYVDISGEIQRYRAAWANKTMKEFGLTIEADETTRRAIPMNYVMPVEKGWFGGEEEHKFLYEYRIRVVGNKFYDSSYSTSTKDTNKLSNLK